MQVSRINNQPNFGIRYIGSQWSSKLENSIKMSKLALETDKKYPEASISYFKFQHKDTGCDEDVWTTLIDYALNPKRIWHYRIDSPDINSADEYLVEKLNKLSLADIESEIDSSRDKFLFNMVKITNKGQEISPIKAFFKKIFPFIGKN